MAFNFDDPRFKFDDKTFKVDESELSQYLDADPNGDEDLLKELERLADASALSPVVQGNFGMIRTAADAGDYNIENVQLTADDENDPALLAELDKMLGNETVQDDIVEDESTAEEPQEDVAESSEVKEEGTLEDLEAELDETDQRIPLEVRLQTKDRDLLLKYIHLEKVRTVTCKKAGDQAGMSDSFKAYKQLQSRLEELDSSANSSEDMLSKLKADALKAKREGNMELAREIMTKVMQLEKAKGKPIDETKAKTAKTKELLSRLGAQIDECYEAVKFYIKSGEKTEAGLFLGRKKAFESDMMAVKSAFLTNEKSALPKGRIVSLQIPISMEVEDVPEDELKVLLSNVKVNPKDNIRKRSKEFYDSKDEHFFRTIFEWPPEATETQHNKSGSSFKPASSANLSDRFTFNGLKRDIKSQKFFEYQKLKIELWRKETSFFRTKPVPVASNQVRLAPLLNQVQLGETVDLVDPNRRSIGVTVDVTFKIQKPISGKSFKFKPVQWIVFDELSSGRLFPDPTAAKAPSASASKSLGASQALDDDKDLAEVEQQVQSMTSYALIEHELDKLLKNPSAMDDPILAARQIALEGRRDAIGMQIEMGQLAIEDYIEGVKKAIGDFKKMALEAKRAGDIDRARLIMSQIQVMEKEVASAENPDEEE